MKEFDDIDRLFQTTFDGFEAIPDPSVKEKIDKAIAPKKNKKRFFFLLFFSSAVFIALGAFIYPDFLIKNTPIATKNGSMPNSNQNDRTIEKSDNLISHQKKTEAIVSNSEDKSAEKHLVTSTINHPRQYDKTPEKESFKKNEQIESSFIDERRTQDEIIVFNPADSIENDAENSIKSDSIEKNETTVVEIQPIGQPSITLQKWYLTAFAGWEGATMKSVEIIDINDLSNAGKESARIKFSSFYGKVEINRRLNDRFHLLAGVGFKSTLYRQNATKYSLDSIIDENEITSTLPNPPLYFLKSETGNQNFQVNTLLFPIGVVFAQPIAEKFHFRLSLGTEFAFGWKKDLVINPILSSPTFQTFGWNVWMRPEFQYTIRKFRISAFGSVNHSLIQQLNWGVDMRKNPFFGAGLGLQFNL